MTEKKRLAGVGGEYSWAQLFNPVSFLTGGGDRYPEWMSRLFYKNPEAAWMTSKIGAQLILGAALAGGARAVQHGVRMQELAESDDPAKNIRSSLGTTFTGQLGPDKEPRGFDIMDLFNKRKKKAKKIKKTAGEEPDASRSAAPAKQWVMWPEVTAVSKNVANVAIPVAALTLAAAAAYKGVDYLADSRRNAVLNDVIARKRNVVRRLMQVRAQQARGTVSDDEVQKALAEAESGDNYIKTAGWKDTLKRLWEGDRQSEGYETDPHPLPRKVLTGLGLLVLGVTGATAAGSYKYFSMSDPDNIKYKAMKKGLREYAKVKAMGTPLTIVPADAQEYFSTIEGPGAADKPKPAREQPELTPASKPISITL